MFFPFFAYMYGNSLNICLQKWKYAINEVMH